MNVYKKFLVKVLDLIAAREARQEATNLEILRKVGDLDRKLDRLTDLLEVLPEMHKDVSEIRSDLDQHLRDRIAHA